MGLKKLHNRITNSLKNKMILMILLAVLPLVALIISLLISLQNYSNAYDEIVSNMTIANSYNLDFREQMDESVYKLVVRGKSFEEGQKDLEVEDPYELIRELRSDFQTLAHITTDPDSRQWLNNLLRNIDTLEDRVNDINEDLKNGGTYNKNIEMLDNNIYVLTELIQDDIQYYIYYQTRSIEVLKTNLNHDMMNMLIIAAVILAVILLFVFLILAVTVKGITEPLTELRSVTKRIATGDFNARAGIRTKDEIAEVSGSVNDMAENLQILVKKIKEDERKMRYVELRLLQEQINPHFLYNALDTIVWLIEGGKPEEAEDMIVSLSTFFKLVLSHGQEFITIREEEQHIRSYLEIQQVRYRDILTYDIDIDPELYHYRILKMTLQPLVENALYHGIKYKRAKGHVQIRGKMTGTHNILFVVADDGVGMEEEELARLREEIQKPCKATETGFGMANVNERIHMNFGWNYGITIESKAGEGTRVEILIPAEWVDSVMGGVAENA